MKFLMFSMYDPAKGAEVALAADKVAETPGSKSLARYICGGLPFPGVPPNTLVGVSVMEFDSSEAMAARMYPVTLAGATIWAVPVLEFPVAKAVETEKKYRK